MLRALSRVLAVLAGMLPVVAAEAGPAVMIDIDLATQQMTVDVDGKRAHAWRVSSARSDYVTPTGTYRPYRMHKMWYSRKYDDAPMPHAIFYSGGFAIHGTTSVGMLGRPASHGCVRLAPSNAAILFTIVQRKGMGSTRIVIRGTPPKPAPVVARRPAAQTVAMAQQPAPSGGLFSALFGPTPAYAAPAYRTQQLRRGPTVVSRSYVTPTSARVPVQVLRVKSR